MAIENRELTNGRRDGNGLVEELMRSVESHLNHQLKGGRIPKDQFAEVYVGSIQGVMTTAVEFLLQRDVQNNQADLIAAQVEEAKIKNQIATKQLLLADKELLKADQEIAKLTAEVKILTIREKIAESELKKLNVDTQISTKQLEVMNAQISKTQADTAMVLTAKDNAIKEGENIVKTGAKLQSEIALLNQKTDTEKAQILDEIDGKNVRGIIDKQKDLYAAQTAGFERDALLKLAKVFVDTWTVRQTTDSADALSAGLNDSNIASVLEKAKNSVGVF